MKTNTFARAFAERSCAGAPSSVVMSSFSMTSPIATLAKADPVPGQTALEDRAHSTPRAMRRRVVIGGHVLYRFFVALETLVGGATRGRNPNRASTFARASRISRSASTIQHP